MKELWASTLTSDNVTEVIKEDGIDKKDDVETPEPAPPKPRWKCVLDAATGKPYYYHRVTRQRTWTKPVKYDEDLVVYKAWKRRKKALTGSGASVDSSMASSLASLDGDIVPPPLPTPENSAQIPRKDEKPAAIAFPTRQMERFEASSSAMTVPDGFEIVGKVSPENSTTKQEEQDENAVSPKDADAKPAKRQVPGVPQKAKAPIDPPAQKYPKKLAMKSRRGRELKLPPRRDRKPPPKEYPKKLSMKRRRGRKLRSTTDPSSSSPEPRKYDKTFPGASETDEGPKPQKQEPKPIKPLPASDKKKVVKSSRERPPLIPPEKISRVSAPDKRFTVQAIKRQLSFGKKNQAPEPEKNDEVDYPDFDTPAEPEEGVDPDSKIEPERVPSKVHVPFTKNRKTHLRRKRQQESMEEECNDAISVDTPSTLSNSSDDNSVASKDPNEEQEKSRWQKWEMMLGENVWALCDMIDTCVVREQEEAQE